MTAWYLLAADTIEALVELARDVQVIFLTCHASTVELIQRHAPTCTTIDLNAVRTMLDEQVARLPLEGIQLTRQLGYIVHTERTLSNAARAFMQLLDTAGAEAQAS